MPRELLQHEIIDHRLQRVFSLYHLVDGVDEVKVWFQLDSGLVFQLPNFADESLQEAVLPPDAEPIEEPSVAAILGARIDRVVRPLEDARVLPGTVCLQLELRRWLRVEEMAGHGTGYAGMHIMKDIAWLDPIVDFWSA